MRVKVRGRLKEMKRKEFKSDCLLGIVDPTFPTA